MVLETRGQVLCFAEEELWWSGGPGSKENPDARCKLLAMSEFFALQTSNGSKKKFRISDVCSCVV